MYRESNDSPICKSSTYGVIERSTGSQSDKKIWTNYQGKKLYPKLRQKDVRPDTVEVKSRRLEVRRKEDQEAEGIITDIYNKIDI